jgi:hypothetical protein
VVVAFVIVAVTLGICIHEIASYTPSMKAPPDPPIVTLGIACCGCGVILAALACVAVTDFFAKKP